MGVTMEFEGLTDLIKECEKLGTPRELEEAERKALKRCGDLAKAEVTGKMARSSDVSKSGRRGSRTFQHSADNVPMKIKKIGGGLSIVIGWDKGDNSPYFYNKFIEFGTSKMPPQAPFKKVFTRQRQQWTKIFIEEYEKLLERLND